MNKTKYFNILTKKFLEKEYISKKKSIASISTKINCNRKTVEKYLKDYGIEIRKNINKGLSYHGYIDGRNSIITYCPDCWELGIKKELRSTRSKRCKHHANKELVKLGVIGLKGNKNGSYIDGRCSKTYYCIDCEKIGIKTEINYYTWYAGKKRCFLCGQKNRKDMFGETNPSYKKEKHTTHYCTLCKTKEISYNNWLHGNKTCLSCAAKERLKNPENHPSWQGGISKEGYPFYFTVELKEQIQQRDNFACQNCSMTEEEHLIVIGRRLHVHHIDYNKKNCKEDNLITLCSSCNARANHNKTYWIIFYQDKIQLIYKNAKI